MKPQEISKLKQLDPTGTSGTIQQVLLDPNINQIPYDVALYHLLVKILGEREYYQKMHQKMFNILKANNFDMNSILHLEEKL